jgi:hypothetical protein
MNELPSPDQQSVFDFLQVLTGVSNQAQPC